MTVEALGKRMTRVEDVNKEILEKLNHLKSFLSLRFRHTIHDPITPSRTVVNPDVPSSPHVGAFPRFRHTIYNPISTVNAGVSSSFHVTVPEPPTSPNLSDMELRTPHTGPSQIMAAPSPSDAPGPEAPPLQHASLNTPLSSCDIPK